MRLKWIFVPIFTIFIVFLRGFYITYVKISLYVIVPLMAGEFEWDVVAKWIVWLSLAQLRPTLYVLLYFLVFVILLIPSCTTLLCLAKL